MQLLGSSSPIPAGFLSIVCCFSLCVFVCLFQSGRSDLVSFSCHLTCAPTANPLMHYTCSLQYVILSLYSLPDQSPSSLQFPRVVFEPGESYFTCASGLLSHASLILICVFPEASTNKLINCLCVNFHMVYKTEFYFCVLGYYHKLNSSNIQQFKPSTAMTPLANQVQTKLALMLKRAS